MTAIIIGAISATALLVLYLYRRGTSLQKARATAPALQGRVVEPPRIVKAGLGVLDAVELGHLAAQRLRQPLGGRDESGRSRDRDDEPAHLVEGCQALVRVLVEELPQRPPARRAHPAIITCSREQRPARAADRAA